MIDFNHLLDWDYYLNSNPGGDFGLGFILLAYFGITLIIPGLLRAKATGNKYLKKSIRKGLWKITATSILGLVLTMARFAQIPSISMRLWLYLVLILSVIALVWTLLKISCDYKKRLDSVKRETQKH